jgi:hypothetical protein
MTTRPYPTSQAPALLVPAPARQRACHLATFGVGPVHPRQSRRLADGCHFNDCGARTDPGQERRRKQRGRDTGVREVT